MSVMCTRYAASAFASLNHLSGKRRVTGSLSHCTRAIGTFSGHGRSCVSDAVVNHRRGMSPDEPLIECVPNFSEGKDENIIRRIAEAFSDTDGVRLLHIDPGVSANRTVYTLVGGQSQIVQGICAAADVASDLIDMRSHSGIHRRLGALDVCPFVPLLNTTMEDAVACARLCGQSLGDRLGVPVYLYEQAAINPGRATVSSIRSGQYEGLESRFNSGKGQPDFGPSVFVPRWGATIMGARDVLVAYNVNIQCSTHQAAQIARTVRESGRGPGCRGRLKRVKADGWYVEEYGFAQVTMNLDDIRVTPLHVAFEEVKREAEAIGATVLGSELIGMVPLRVLVEAGNFYMTQDGVNFDTQREMIEHAVYRLGLAQIQPFDTDSRVLEYALGFSESQIFMSSTF